MRIKTAVIGCGSVTRIFHLPSLLQNPAFEIAALVDPNVSAARRLTKEFGIAVPVAKTVQDLPPVGAAIVAVPPRFHAEVCVPLLHKGVHVLCEKPMASSGDEGESMMKAARDGKAVLLIGMQKHHCPNMKLLKDILKDGMLGHLEGFEVVSSIHSQWDTANTNRFDPEYSKGGILFEYGIHWIYRLIYWFGIPKLLRYADDRIDGVEANAIIECVSQSYGQETPGSLYFSWDHNLKNSITISGKHGTAEVRENNDSTVFVTRVIHDKPKIMEIKNRYEEFEVDLFDRQLQYFAECIDRGLLDPEPTGFALEALNFVEDCYRNRVSVDQPWVFHGISKRKGRASD